MGADIHDNIAEPKLDLPQAVVVTTKLLGGHLKTGQLGSPQNRPVERIQDSFSFTSPATVSATVFR
jgi:hypothetical protein